MTRRDPVILEAGKLVGGGVALGHAGGATWMIRGALPGETVRAVPVRRRARVVEAETESVVARPHSLRAERSCLHADSCGGCDWPFVRAEAGAALKPPMAAEAVRRYPDLAELLARAPIVSSPDRYRLRARWHWDAVRGVLGFYRHRSNEVEPVPECRVVSPTAAGHREPIARILARRCPEPVDVEWLEDLSGEAAVLALRTTRLTRGRPDRRWLPEPRELGATVVGAWLVSANGLPTAGWGAEGVTMDLPISLEVPAGAFFQGNRHLVPALFARIGELAGEHRRATWDLHAGVGFLAAAVRASSDPPLHLTEPHRGAARAARRNLPGAKVAEGVTAERGLASAGALPRQALVLADPPRSGLSRDLTARLVSWSPEQLIMLSCDVATWARDVARLMEGGAHLDHVELWDLFPLTHHVEVVSVLST